MTTVAQEGNFELIVCPRGPNNPRNSEGDVVKLSDGRLLLAWTEFYGGTEDDSAARIRGKLSADGGRSWGPKFSLQENTGGMNVMGPQLLRVVSGELALFYQQIDATNSSHAYLRKSCDEGRTWTPSVRITPDITAYQSFTNARAIQLQSGRIVVPGYVGSSDRYAPPYYGGPYVAYAFYSDDNGNTWRRSDNGVSAAKRGAMEPCIVELKDGRLLMIMRTQLGRIYRAYSADAGRTWSQGEPMDVVAPESTSVITRIPKTGDLLLVWNNTTFDPEHDHCGLRCPLTTAVSGDEAQSFGHHRNLESDWAHTFAMPSISFDDSHVIFTYYVAHGSDIEGHWELKLKIVPLAWLYE